MERMVSGVRVAPGVTVISHLFFTDDSVVFCKAYEMEAGNIIKILENYGKESGQIINLEKVLFSLGRVV